MAVEKLYTLAEAALILQRTRRTVYSYVHTGRLKAIKFNGSNDWRVAEKDLKNFMAGK